MSRVTGVKAPANDGPRVTVRDRVRDGLRAEGIYKIFPPLTRALDGVSFHAPPGRVVALLGPSGCGKTTLLRIVAGLEQASAGTLTMDGEPFDTIPAEKRDVGFVFQNYALYPHLTVAQNIGLALEVRGVKRDEREVRVRRVADRLGLAKVLERKPAALSGGEQQRVALGRALVKEPRLYLLDEPLSNLDASLRDRTRGELKAIFRSVEAPVLYVTHDQSEAMSLADEVMLLCEGHVEQSAAPHLLYQTPESLFSATFVGSPRINVWHALTTDSSLDGEGVRALAPPGLPESNEWSVCIRPEDVEVMRTRAQGAWQADVLLAEPLGGRELLTLRVGQLEFRALAAPIEGASSVWVRWPAGKLHWFPKGGRRHQPPAVWDTLVAGGLLLQA
ncbi:MAG TPA: ABC transporter ATP-binding protein [Candidatus Eisenbacteria bacterium]|jgi:sn-glycerol 3-phosphate transport system ATP-binding protein|nr:ABC transporter ATP-binding protein [Candidatus Eisenbacteria bacterium]